MLVHGTPPRMIHKPIPNTVPMKATETLQPRHLRANLEFLKANRAFGIIDAVFLGRAVDEHPCAAGVAS